MATFEVKGSNKNGKDVKLYIDADSVKSARAKARAQGVIPVSVKGSEQAPGSPPPPPGSNKPRNKKFRSTGKVSVQELSAMTRQFSTLVKSHVPIVESLSALVEQIQSPKIQPMLMSVRQHVKEGQSLGDSFAMFPNIFDRVYVNMVRAGENSGRLDVVLARLADFSEAQVRLKNKVSGAMIYPIIMMVVGLLVMVMIFTVVIPQILRIFKDMDAELPTMTKLLIGISDYMRDFGAITAVVVFGGLVLLQRFFATENGRAVKDRYLLRVPVLKHLMTALAVSRFSRTLGVMLQSGVPMLGAMKITRNVVSNVVYENALDYSAEQISEGRSLNAALKQTGLFPPIVIHMVGVGEKTGELENMLLSVADNYDQDIETQLNRFTALLEPAMIIAMVFFVGFIVAGILQPLMQMQNFR